MRADMYMEICIDMRIAVNVDIQRNVFGYVYRHMCTGISVSICIPTSCVDTYADVCGHV